MDRILALDLGKNKTAVRLRVEDGRKDHTEVVPTTAAALKQVVENTRPTLVILEMSTTTYWVRDVIVKMGVEVLVTANNSPCWKWKNSDRKSDATDTDKLINLFKLKQLEPVHMPEEKIRQWRSLIAFRHSVVRSRVKAKNYIKSILCGQNVQIEDAGSAWTARWVTAVRAHAKPLAECGPEELWRGRLMLALAQLDLYDAQINEMEVQLDKIAARKAAVALLQKEPGVGPRLAEIIVAMIDDPLRFMSGKQVACYAGLTPRYWSSGQTERSGHISKQGNTLLRSLLVEVSWVAIRHNPWLKAIFEHVKKDVKGRGKIAIVAAARRLLIKLWAIWRDFELGKGSRPALAR